MKNFTVLFLCALLVCASLGEVSAGGQFDIDEAQDPASDSLTLHARPRRAVCQGVLFLIICQATCDAQKRGKSFCDNGKCGCR